MLTFVPVQGEGGEGKEERGERGGTMLEEAAVHKGCRHRHTLMHSINSISYTLLTRPVAFWNFVPIPMYRENETPYAIPT